ncbi:hypothetical protein FB45DRAFT_361566 [Roridomyces roridus]|uniref:F-box domain-containing protein n=1 Tax=Roridomyces roridus TaxID=1738132 RepID=A0AAD7C862_9AGAR|nr:hypothetical protein FB45DRAFT_361566 [Roridomyces roridus]
MELSSEDCLHDPVGQLPPEISSEIFILCLDDYPDLQAQSCPTLLLTVCRAWAAVALATPALWRRMRVAARYAGRTPFQERIMHAWFQRAGTSPLSLCLEGSWTRENTEIVREYATRIEELETKFTISSPLTVLIREGELPALKTLKLWGGFSTNEAVEVLRTLPHLVECTFDALRFRTPFDGAAPLVHFNMQHFHVGGVGDILQGINMPNLATLSLSTQFVALAQLVSFLRRSTPPLRDVLLGWHELGAPVVAMQAQLVNECCSLLPMLQTLEVIVDRINALSILTVLADSAHLVPNLCTLTVRLHDWSPTAAVVEFYEQLLAVVLARRSTLRKIRVFHAEAGSTDSSPVQTVIGTLQVLDGLDVRVEDGKTRDSTDSDTDPDASVEY